MQPGTLVAGKYRVERVIGRGGMGLVVEATHIHLHHQVALKFLADEMILEQTAVARFNREARASAQLKSEHICHVADYGIDGKSPYIVMELLQGTDLAKLANVRVLDVPTAALYIKQACIGLAEAHAAGIIHRNLKPGNLFLTRRQDGSPLIKILDFGVAKAPIGENDVNLTGTSNVVGSPGFMSPEQFRSSKSVDGRADIWALGVMLYKLVSGRLPFKADGFAEFALAITRDEMPPLSEAPPEFEAVVAKCLQKDPSKRYTNVTELAHALAPFAVAAKPSARQMTVPPTQPDDISGIGGMDGPDTNSHTQVLGGAAPLPKPAIAKVPAMVKVPAPAGVVAVAPIRGAAPPAAVVPAQQYVPAPAPRPAEPARTVLGVSNAAGPPAHKAPVAAATDTVLGGHAPGATKAQPVVKEAATPAQTVSGTAVGIPGKLYMLTGELPAGTVVGEYRIENKIGEGGMGVVYSAIHPMIGKRAAIKVISSNLGTDPVIVERFVQEARSVNQIQHPNIVDVFAFGKLPDGRSYFVMEHLQGESLRARLYRAFMSIPDAIQILDDVTGALEAAHQKGIVHRDLKPDNVFLASVRGGFINVKLLDFGIAKLVTDGGIAKTTTGELMGTPGYLSPEQARGKNVDYRTDVYALGAMMYEMITGRLPFIAESPMDIVMMHITTPPTKPSVYKADIPVVLEQMIMGMLAKQPEQRPTLGELRNVFAELVASGQVQLEAGTSSTFRSDLKSRPASSPRNQMVPRPTEAQTAVHFVPGPDTLSPSDQHKTRVADAASPPKSRVGLAMAIMLVAALAAAITMIVIFNPGGSAATHDAGVAVVTPPAADAGGAMVNIADATAVAVALDAQVEPAAPVDAPELRELVITIDSSDAKVEVDGVAVDVHDRIAKVSLPDGPHRVVVSAPRRQSVDLPVDVSEATRTVDVKLGKIKRATPPATSQQAGSGPGSAIPPTTTKPPPFHDKNAPIDPF